MQSPTARRSNDYRKRLPYLAGVWHKQGCSWSGKRDTNYGSLYTQTVTSKYRRLLFSDLNIIIYKIKSIKKFILSRIIHAALWKYGIYIYIYIQSCLQSLVQTKLQHFSTKEMSVHSSHSSTEQYWFVRRGVVDLNLKFVTLREKTLRKHW